MASASSFDVVDGGVLIPINRKCDRANRSTPSAPQVVLDTPTKLIRLVVTQHPHHHPGEPRPY